MSLQHTFKNQDKTFGIVFELWTCFIISWVDTKESNLIESYDLQETNIRI